jgi:deoxyribonuclease-4
MKIGAHASTPIGISNAIVRGQKIGCEAIQIFGSSPQAWAFKVMPGDQIERFEQGLIDSGIGPVFLHVIYLINLGTPSKGNLQKGIDSLINYTSLAAEIGTEGVIVHPGSHGGKGFEAMLPQGVDALKIVLDASAEGPVLAMENMAGTG